MNKDLVLVISQKGGVGKSTFTRALVETLRAVRDDVSAYDADGSVGQLLQFLGTRTEFGADTFVDPQDATRGVAFFDVREERQRGQLINILDEEPNLAIVDLPGGSLGAVAEVLGDTRKMVESFTQAGYRLHVVLVITQVKAGVHAVEECIAKFGPDVHYVVVRNLAFAQIEDYLIFDGYIDRTHGDPANGYKMFGKAKDKLLEAGGEVINLPKIQALTYGLLDNTDLSFTAGMQRSSGLAFQQREHCRIFLAEFKAEIMTSRLGQLFTLPKASDATVPAASTNVETVKPKTSRAKRISETVNV